MENKKYEIVERTYTKEEMARKVRDIDLDESYQLDVILPEIEGWTIRFRKKVE
jgi:hypothetical protein